MPVDAPPENYHEDEGFKCYGDPEPHIRSQDIIYRSGDYKWHIKVTFRGTILRTGDTESFLSQQSKRAVRGHQLREFIQYIRFETLPLLDNRVTEVVFEPVDTNERIALPLESSVKNLPESNGYRQFCGQFHHQLIEDSSKVLYPPFLRNCSILVVPYSSIKKVRHIAPAVSLVQVGAGNQEYIFKSIDRPLYQPRDSCVLESELRNLLRLRQSTGIIQLVSVICSGNPYHTGRSKDQIIVLRGFLLEYHAAGTLEDMLRQNQIQKRWPLQIARALHQLHQNEITHMDLKPSNIVIDTKDDAVIIDISGLATTHEWTAPELRGQLNPTSLPWEARVRNDIWALGRLFSMLIPPKSDRTEFKVLNEIVKKTTTEKPEERLELRAVIKKLEQCFELPGHCSHTSQ